MDQEKIGNTIKNIRLENKLTQKEFADALGVTYQAVSKWENGKNLPDIGILKDISEKFNVDLNVILDTKKENVSKEKSNKKLYVIITCIGLVLIGIVIAFCIHLKNDDFDFKKIDTTCDEFEISGSVAYNSSKTYIYISDIKYCGKENNTVYKKITSQLYLSYNDIDQKIYSETKENSNLSDYLENFSMSVNSNICLDFKGDLILTINAYDEDNKITVYDVPLQLSNTCTLK